MKRIYIIVFMLLSTLVCSAREVPQRLAEKIAKSFFENNPTTKAASASLTLLWDGLELGPSTKSYSMTPPFYVYGLDGEAGFIVVSGDDICRPVLGYSYEHPFDLDNMPSGMRDWFEMSRDIVSHAKKNRISPSSSVIKEWEMVSSKPNKATSFNTIKVLETAQWNQTDPYNRKCPILWDRSNVPTYTGCVNTACAIVMKYWEYPEAGKGTVKGYDYYSDYDEILRHIDGHSLDHKYRWDDMLMKYDGQFNDSQADAVATLMFDLGMMNGSSWGYDIGTPSRYNTKGLVEKFGYDESIAYVKRESIATIDEWYVLFHKEIDEGRPVLYHGRSSSRSGHASVLDGYAVNNYYSINWGWGGVNNGFFTIDPSLGNVDFTNYPFLYGAVLGMKPDDGVDECISFPLKCSEIYSTLPASLRHNRNTFTTKLLLNNPHETKATVTNNVFVALMNNGKLVKRLSEETIITKTDTRLSWYEIECEVPKDLNESDYICIFYLDVNGEWKQYPNSEIMLSEKGPISSGLSVSWENQVLTFRNVSKSSIVEISGDILEPDHYMPIPIQQNRGSCDFTVSIYDCFSSHELTVKL